MASSMLFDITAQDRASSEFVAIAGQVEVLQRKLRELDGKRVKASVALNTPSAAKLTALNGLAASLRDIDGLNARARVDVQGIPTAATANALRRTAVALRELDGLDATARVDITGLGSINPSEIRRAARALRELEGIGAIAIHISVTGAVDALAQVVALRQGLRALPGSTDLDVNVNASKGIAAASLVTVKMLAIGAAALYTIPLLGSLTANTASLGGALVSLAGLAPLAVGALAAAGVAAGALAVGLGNIGDALGETDTPAKLKKVNEAIAALSPSARSAVQEIRGLGPAWSTLRLDVQERLFKGLSTEIAGLAKTYLPVLKTGLGGVATEFNLATKDVAGFMREVQAVRDIEAIFRNTGEAMAAARPSARALLEAFVDISVVGTQMLPELATGWTSVTARFRDFIAEARETGQLEEWIRGGTTTLATLGSVAGNVGGVLRSMYTAARDSGADFLGTLDRVTERMRDFLRSAEGQRSLIAFFSESRAAIDGLLPGLERLGSAAVDAISGFARAEGLQSVAGSFDAITKSVAPLISTLGELTGGVLAALGPLGPRLLAMAIGFKLFGAAGAAAAGSLVTFGPVLAGIINFLGPIAPLIGAAVIAFKTFGVAAAAFVAWGAAINGLALATGWGAASVAVRGFGAAVSAMGRALPLVGVAVVGLGFAFDALNTSASEAVEALTRGGAAAAEANIALQEQDAHLQRLRDGNPAFIAGMQAWIEKNIMGRASTEDANAALAEQRAKMTDLQRAQQDLTTAQGNYQLAVDTFTANSPQARDAAAALAAAQDGVEAAQGRAADATKTHTDRMVDQMNQSALAASADLQYLDSLDRVTEAQNRAAEAARNHKAGSKELEQANRDVLQSSLDAAAAAGRKAEADAVAANASNAAEIGAQAQKEEYLRLAAISEEPTRTSLLNLANGTDTAARAAATAEIQARLQKDELLRLASTSVGPVREAIEASAKTFDTLGGAHATAETRALLQKNELIRLRDTTPGLRDEIQRMIDRLNAIQSKSVNVTANGILGPIRTTSTGEVLGRGNTGLATGGILPGYTPGRDPHQFASPTGGLLALSGGEAVMRPEWTRAVGPAWVHGANRAARTGGVGGVASFIQRTAPRAGVVEGVRGDGSRFASGGIFGKTVHRLRPDRKLATGGIIRTGISPLSEIAARGEQYTSAPQIRAVVAEMVRRIKAEEARIAAAAGGGAASGPITAGAAAGLNWARGQVGKPYVWGGVGPGGYDCSGFMSAILNVMRGRNPHSRVGATGNFPWAGFRPGIGPGLNIGSFRGNPGHMAGTIGGTNVEASGGVGVRVGGGARGAGHSMFNTRAHIFDRGGLLRHGQLGLNLSGATERVLNPRETRDYDSRVNMANQLSPLRSMRDRAADNGPVVAALARLEAATAKNSRLDRLVGLLEQNGAGATVNVYDQSGNPVETGRASAMAIRRFR